MFKIIRDGISKNLISLLLSVSIVSSCMYIYCPESILILTAAIFVIQALVFSFYSYIAEKSMLMRFISVVGSFVGICGLVVIAIQTGQNKNSIDFFVWFLSPQALVTFSPSYIAATFIVINFFISSTIYYFSAVRYRISMTFLITLIPFAFYRKEGNGVPVFYAFLLLVLYVTLMIHCRNMSSKLKQKLIINNGYRKSIIYFLMLSSLITPKPETNFSTSIWLSNLIDSEKISQYMLSKLGIVSTTASSSIVYTDIKDIHLYTFIADELPVNIKSQTFSKYDFSKNLWSVSDCDVDGSAISSTNIKLLNPSMFYEAVACAADKSSEFAQKYNIEKIRKELRDNYSKSLSMTYRAVESKYYLAPTLTYDIRNDNINQVFRARNGMIYNIKSSGLVNNIMYYSQQSADDHDFRKVIENISISEYPEFLDQLNEILSEDEKYHDIIEAYIQDYNWAAEYLSSNNDNFPDSVKELAQKITEKYDSDYEKAIAIQNYFALNDFSYNLNYKKPVDYDMCTFLFESKTGICSDYATAMVILARCAGIPARYAEGVHLYSKDNTNIVKVTDSDLHAFPELFISGYGWMTFEPTQVSDAQTTFFTEYIITVFIIAGVFVLILLIILFYIYIYPGLCDTIYKHKVRKSSPEDAVIITAEKIRKCSEADNSASSDEVAALIKEKYNFDVGNILKLFDSVVYGKQNVSKEDSMAASEKYMKLRKVIKEHIKNERRGRRLWIRKKR